MKLNVNSIRQRLRRLERYISELEKQQKVTLEIFQQDFTLQLAVERAFQGAVEACIDIASHLVSVYQLGKPVESRDVFYLLVQAEYLDPAYGDEMATMVSLRNRLVHLYWDIDVEKLYQYLGQDVILLQRFRDFTLQLLTVEEDADL